MTHNINEFDPHIVWVGFWIWERPVCGVNSKLDALRKAYELSAKTTSYLDAPSFIIRSATNEKIDARDILAEWDARGWPRPTPSQA